jgi:hypothetical protein
MGIIKNNHVEWVSDDGTARVIIKHTGITSERRQIYMWQVKMGRRNVGRASDINSGCGAPVDTLEALRSFSSFLGAWDEALRYGGESENRDLFPMSMERFCTQYSDELYMDMCNEGMVE